MEHTQHFSENSQETTHININIHVHEVHAEKLTLTQDSDSRQQGCTGG